MQETYSWDVPGRPVGKSPSFYCRGHGVRSLVVELRSYMPSCAAPHKKKKKKERKKKYTLVIGIYYKLLEILGGCYSDMDLTYPLS